MSGWGIGWQTRRFWEIYAHWWIQGACCRKECETQDLGTIPQPRDSKSQLFCLKQCSLKLAWPTSTPFRICVWMCVHIFMRLEALMMKSLWTTLRICWSVPGFLLPFDPGIHGAFSLHQIWDVSQKILIRSRFRSMPLENVFDGVSNEQCVPSSD